MLEKIKTAFKESWVYWLIIAVLYYLLPLIMRDVVSAMLVLWFALPLACLVCSLHHGVKRGFRWYFFIVVALLFVPAIYLYFNSSAWFYTLLYAGVTLLGSFIGGVVCRPKKRK